jgi:PAS domain S-box-containing protein
MKLFYKISAVLLVAFLIPLLLLGVTGYLSVREIGDRTTATTSEVLLRAEKDHLFKRARTEALELENLCSAYEMGVRHLRSHFEFIARDLGRYDLGALPAYYRGVDTAGLPAYGYVHPAHGAYADFDGKVPGGPWVPRPVIQAVRKDPELRRSVAQSLHRAMLFDAHLELATLHYHGTVDLAWLVSRDRVTNARPEYDYNDLIARNPAILDLDESQEAYVRSVDPAHDPERRIRWLEPYLDNFKRVWMTSCVAPVYIGETFAGSTGMDILLSVIAQRFAGAHGGEEYAFLASAGGKMLASDEAGILEIAWDPVHQQALRQVFLNERDQHWTPEMIEACETRRLDQSPNPEVRALVRAMLDGQSGVRELNLSGETKLVAFAPVRTTGWGLAIVVPERIVIDRAQEVRSTFVAGTQSTMLRYVMNSSVVLLISVIVGFVLHYFAVRPLNQLTRRVASVRWDNLSLPPIPKPRRDEIGRLYAKFDEMVTALREARNEAVGSAEEIRSVNAKLESANLELARELRERVQVEQFLSREKELLAVTLRSIGDGVITADREGRVGLLNRKAEEFTGWTQAQAVGRPLEEVFDVREDPGQLRPDGSQVVTLEGLGEGTLVSRDGTERLIANSGAPIRDRDGAEVGTVIVFRDVSVRKRLEEEVIRSQKLESVKVLAAGIAHDFNNLLTAILGNLSLTKREPSLSARALDRLTDAEKASARARSLTQQLLTFSSGGAPVRGSVDLRKLVPEAAAFALRGSNVSLDLDFDADLRPVFADEGQVAQVVQNLVINADQAMPRGGTVRITATNFTVQENDRLPLGPGDYVRVSVGDQGLGIHRDHLAGIFEPFYSTKAHGSGLGLAVCFSILQRHGGHIEVESEPGKGTEFRFYLPVALDVPAEVGVMTSSPPGGSGRILVMDDEDMIRLLAENMLTSLGYCVDTACDGEEVLDMVERGANEGQPYDAVILDLTIRGGLGGQETVGELAKRFPGIPAIVSSGYSNDPVLSDFAAYGFRATIPKPYDLHTVAETLSKVLAASRLERSVS